MGAIGDVTVRSSPPWIDVVASIAPVEIFDTGELALLAVHPDGCVTAWSPQDPSVLLMRKRPMKVSCVATAHETVQHSALAWFGGPSAVHCYRVRCRGGQHVHLQLLYKLRLDGTVVVRDLQTDGNSLVAVIDCESPEVFFWPTIGYLANANNSYELAARCVSFCIFGSPAKFLGAALGKVSSLLMTESTVWIGCTSGAILLLETRDIGLDVTPSFSLRTAGACPVTALALLSHPPRKSIVVSGLENGDIILWSAGAGAQIGQYFEHVGAICSMAYVPWGGGLCTVSTTREVFFWGWQDSPHLLTVMERGVLDDDMGSTAVRCLCPIRGTYVLACAAETSHILHWKTQNTTDAMVGTLSTMLPVSSDVVHVMPGELQDPSLESRPWQECDVSDEADHRKLQQDALVSEIDPYGLPTRVGEVEEGTFQKSTHSAAYLEIPGQTSEKSHVIETLAMKLKAAHQQRKVLFDTLHKLEVEREKTRAFYEAELVSLRKANMALVSCTTALKSKLDEGNQRHFSRRTPREGKMVGTSDHASDHQTLLSTLSQPERSAQAASRFMSSCTGEKREKNGTLPGMSCDFSGTVSGPLCDSFMGGPAKQLSLAGQLPLSHYVTSHPLNDGQSELLQVTGEGTASASVVNALLVQLSLMELLLRNYREAFSSRDSLQIHSTNILSDVYLMARDVLGGEMASAVVQEALEGMPLLNEHEVIRKLFLTLCHKYRAAVSHFPSRSI
ncbi:hypothetical protein MOQ_002574 [Trypanosoma cruzi marinkellei]|uniref:Uncharacterized protein n=1 Tax=Trypanosoma cruzi marinkellei TaxID=85056 RepID=K2NXI7_TRYCR|nr:hypothetical protein MOQ_002574 [Trypanosoma cruzi marinkellei]